MTASVAISVACGLLHHAVGHYQQKAAAKPKRLPKPRLTAAEKREAQRLTALEAAKEKRREYHRDYQRQMLLTPEGRAKHVAATRKHHANNPHRQIANKLRVRVGDALKNNGARKAAKTMELIGCTIEHLMAHLERQFQPGMTWANQGEWHIDHIRPCASFDLTDPELQRHCFHWSNLQPLWAAENLGSGPIDQLLAACFRLRKETER
ncbi:hypothetical protein [Gemmobacter sp.]|uniref:hypothetical protein n=1 Tax=Gemmobacter sp. TaxID=1898957 RepID=UPI002AFDDFF3|nr:hypothetical protein [Gemmobacter sp.]